MNKEFDKVKELEAEKYWSFPSSYTIERKKSETQSMVFSNDYIGSKKMDGYYYRFIKDLDGNIYLQSRNRGVSGQFSEKIGHLPHLSDFFGALPNGTVLLGEVYMRDGISKNVTTIMGCLEAEAIRRQEQDPSKKLYYYIFDIWYYDGNSLLKSTAEDRFSLIEKLSKLHTHPYVEWAEFYRGKELWQHYQKILADGGEGIVMVKANSTPNPGKRTARKTLKLKKELQETLDVIVIGANPPTRLYTGKDPYSWQYWLDVKTSERLYGNHGFDYMKNNRPLEPITKGYFHGWAGSLKLGVYKDDKIVQVGSLSGVPDEVLENWRSYVGRVMEVTAMEVFEDTGGIRHPRFVKWRDDLVDKDCTWEKIVR